MLLNEENLIKVLDRIVSRPKLGPAMKAVGGSEKLIFTWLKRSANNKQHRILNSETSVHWPDPDGDAIEFVDAVQLARKQHLVLLDATIRDEVENGSAIVHVDGGRMCWQENEEIVASGIVDPDVIYLLYGQRDIWQRDEHGRRVPLVTHVPAPAMLRVHALKSLMSGTYNPSERREVDQRISGGVMVIGSAPTKAPEQIAPPETPAVQAQRAIDQVREALDRLDQLSPDDPAQAYRQNLEKIRDGKTQTRPLALPSTGTSHDDPVERITGSDVAADAPATQPLLVRGAPINPLPPSPAPSHGLERDHIGRGETVRFEGERAQKMC